MNKFKFKFSILNLTDKLKFWENQDIKYSSNKEKL